MNNYQAVISKYGEHANVWMITFHDGTGWEQSIYVIAPDRRFAKSVARSLTAFDKPRFHSSTPVELSALDPSEIEAFIGPTGQPQNIAIFDAEPQE